MYSRSTCPHLDAELAKGKRPNLHCWYDSVCARLTFPTTRDSPVTMVTAADFWTKHFKCGVCSRSERLRSLPLLTCCTSCCTFLCMKHMPAHLRDRKHPLALSLGTGHIYCLYCGDFVYSSCIEDKRQKLVQKFRLRLGMKTKVWSMKKEDIHGLMKTFPLRKPLEVRGIYNMGNTCYMNCVVQALIHTPLLKPIFTEPKEYCQVKNNELCFKCEVSTVVQTMNSNTVAAVAAPRLLSLLWKLAPHLSGYLQHDAQEFFLAAHDLMHRHFQHVQDNSKVMSPDCRCIMHRAFDGKLSTLASCDACRKYWTSNDATGFLDVQICIPQTENPLHLNQLIEEYCKVESCEHTPCEHCRHESTKRWTKFKKLPVILVFHLSRRSTNQKINTVVKYDSILDMTEYTVDYENCPEKYEDGSLGMLERIKNRYSLYAVVNHSGTMETGHYISYVKSAGNSWFECDDEVLSSSLQPFSSVQAAEPAMSEGSESRDTALETVEEYLMKMDRIQIVIISMTVLMLISSFITGATIIFQWRVAVKKKKDQNALVISIREEETKRQKKERKEQLKEEKRRRKMEKKALKEAKKKKLPLPIKCSHAPVNHGPSDSIFFTVNVKARNPTMVNNETNKATGTTTTFQNNSPGSSEAISTHHDWLPYDMNFSDFKSQNSKFSDVSTAISAGSSEAISTHTALFSDETVVALSPRAEKMIPSKEMGRNSVETMEKKKTN